MDLVGCGASVHGLGVWLVLCAACALGESWLGGAGLAKTAVQWPSGVVVAAGDAFGERLVARCRQAARMAGGPAVGAERGGGSVSRGDRHFMVNRVFGVVVLNLRTRKSRLA